MLVASTVNVDLSNLAKKLKKVKDANYTTYIGFLEPSRYPDGKSVAYIAYLNEYGQHNPPRPFMQRTAEQHFQEWIELFGKTLAEKGISADSIFTAHKRVGIKGVGDMKKTIKEWSPNDPRPNKPATIRRKAKRARSGKGLVPINPETVLIDSGVMIMSVRTNTVKE